MVKVRGATNLLMAVTFRWVTDRESAHTERRGRHPSSVAARHDATGLRQTAGTAEWQGERGWVSRQRIGFGLTAGEGGERSRSERLTNGPATTGRIAISHSDHLRK
jgi:hypothetical protein